MTDHSTAKPLIGSLVANRYRVERVIGMGGMGAVLAARDEQTDAPVALKMILGELAGAEGVVSRFAREAKAATSLDHPNIVRVLDAGVDQGKPYLAMEQLKGQDLGSLLRDRDHIGVEETAAIIDEVLLALSHAHERGIVHRDLKPDNIFLADGPHGRTVKLLDFGISKLLETTTGTNPIALTRKDAVVGTPYYMSPEQAMAASDVDGRADLFGVGAIAFECLVGRPPFIEKSLQAVVVAICMKDAPELRDLDLGLSDALSEWAKKSLARKRDARFTTAEEMRLALKVALSAPRVTAMPKPAAAETAPAADPPAAHSVLVAPSKSATSPLLMMSIALLLGAAVAILWVFAHR